MADTSAKLRAITAMIEEGLYFTINRPRQYGKTTTLYLLDKQLNQTGTYLAIRISFEGVGDVAFEDENRFCNVFLTLLQADLASLNWAEGAIFLKKSAEKELNISELSAVVTQLTERSEKGIVLFIDEVDKSSNNQLFISFLGMLRQKFLNQQEGKDTTFHSVVLAGVHDVRSLKAQIRPGETAKQNSPWNIAADFKVDLSLHVPEIASMLEDYARERQVALDPVALAERLFFYTSGYPFLVCKLCKMVDETFLPEKTTAEWTVEDLDRAAQALLMERNVTNFDSLIKNLHNNEELCRIATRIIIDGEAVDYNPYNADIGLGLLYGLFDESPDKRGKLILHNRIYRELVANFLISRWQTASSNATNREIDHYNFRGQFVRPDGSLDFELVLTRFQAFMREQYHKADRNFLEQQARLIFLAFVRPIINGSGYDFKEPQLSEERRTDVAITFNQFRYVVELKIWRGPKAHTTGLAQLGGYLDTLGLTTGFLVIFDHSSVKSWDKKWLLEEVPGKKIFAVWV